MPTRSHPSRRRRFTTLAPELAYPAFATALTGARQGGTGADVANPSPGITAGRRDSPMDHMAARHGSLPSCCRALRLVEVPTRPVGCPTGGDALITFNLTGGVREFTG